MNALVSLRDAYRQFSGSFWRFFSAAFAFDLGTGLFIFLLSLYLTTLGFNELSIGRFMAALTLGNLAGTLPATLIARRYGLRALLLISFVCSPAAGAMRVLAGGATGQLVLAFLQGAFLSGWPISFAPTVAKLTREENRSSGFSIMFATGIGIGILSGIAGGWIPSLLVERGFTKDAPHAMQWVLLGACILVFFAALPILQLNLRERLGSKERSARLVHPFLLRFLPPFVLWNVATGSFPVFGAIYLQKVLGLSLLRIGTVFSAAQLAQCASVLMSPMLFKRAGLARGVAAAQFASAVCIALLASTTLSTVSCGLYVLYSAFLFLCGPGIYNLLMNEIPETERSTASAIQNACGAVCQAASAALTGFVIVHSGYRALLAGNVFVAVCTGALFLGLASRRSTPAHATSNALSEVQT